MKKIIIFIFCSLALISCEEEVSNVELPFSEKLVVNCLVKSDSIIKVDLTKTLPPLADYNREYAIIPDAIVTIESEGKIYNLKYHGNGIYSDSNLFGKINSEYELNITWRNLKAKAHTIVPPKPEIDTVRVIYELSDRGYGYETYRYNLYVFFKPQNDFQYIAGYSNTYKYFTDISTYINYNNIYSDLNSDKNGVVKA